MTLLFAIDGLEPSLVDRFIADGSMPVVASLAARGTKTTIRSHTVLSSPVIWTSVATGVAPERHGVASWQIDDRPVRSTDRTVPAFWNILSEAGLRSAVVGWLAAFPAEENAGIIVPDGIEKPLEAGRIAPADSLDLTPYRAGFEDTERLLGQFTSLRFDPEFRGYARSDPRFAVNFLLSRRLLFIAARDQAYTDIAVDLMKRDELDLVALYLRGADYVAHGFWQYFDPQSFRDASLPVDEIHVESLKSVIPAYYRKLDSLVGRVLEAAGDDANVILVSDHGFGPAVPPFPVGGDFLSGSHREQGVLVLAGPAFVRGGLPHREPTHYDILPTLLYLLDLPLARDFEGRLLAFAVQPDRLRSSQPRRIDSYGDRGVPARKSPQSESDAEELQELRSLGYIQ